MFNHLILLCWNTTTEHLEVASCRRAQMFWSSSTTLIRYSPLQQRDTSTGPQQAGCVCRYVLRVGGAAAAATTSATTSAAIAATAATPAVVGVLPSAAAWRMFMDVALTARLKNPWGPKRDEKQLAPDWLKWCLGLSHTPRDRPRSARSAVGARVCSTSHQGEERRGGSGGGGGGVQCRPTVEVGEKFSEGIHCPLTERTA